MGKLTYRGVNGKIKTPREDKVLTKYEKMAKDMAKLKKDLTAMRKELDELKKA